MFEAQIAKGIALLDEKYPGWEEKIDLSILDIGSGCECIVGQLYPDQFNESLFNLFPEGDTVHKIKETRKHGLSIDCHDMTYAERDNAYADLTDEWIAFISKRI